MAQCIQPFQKKNELSGRYDNLPCGKCYECKRRRISGWSFRLMKQGLISTSAFFVTLTYEKPPMSANKFMTLNKDDLQNFFKRLRKLNGDEANGENPIKYYACGEYGSKTFRPHYHIILFNAVREQILDAWKLDNKGIGYSYIGDVNAASIGYTLKYICKEKTIPMHKNDDRLKEFSLMSKGLVRTTLVRK